MPASPRERKGGPLRNLLADWSARLQGVFRPAESPADPLEGLPRYFIAFVLLFAVGMLLISLFGDQGLIAYYRFKGQARQLQRDVVSLSERRGELAREIRALREDSAYIELLARQRLGLVRPGEIVVQLPAGPALDGERRP